MCVCPPGNCTIMGPYVQIYGAHHMWLWLHGFSAVKLCNNLNISCPPPRNSGLYPLSYMERRRKRKRRPTSPRCCGTVGGGESWPISSRRANLHSEHFSKDCLRLFLCLCFFSCFLPFFSIPSVSMCRCCAFAFLNAACKASEHNVRTRPLWYLPGQTVPVCHAKLSLLSSLLLHTSPR